MGCIRKVGSFCKGCGQIAKVGQKRKGKGGVKTQMKFYDKDKLLHVALDRGYRSFDAIAKALSKTFGISTKATRNRITNGNLSKEECEVIGSYFKMTMKEYYDVFMNGLFQEDMEGHYICHIEEPYLHIHPKLAESRIPKRKKSDEILAEIDKIE